MSTSKFLKLYTDSKDANAKFTIDCSGTNAVFKSDLDLKLDCDLAVKQGAVYKSLSMEIFTNLPSPIINRIKQILILCVLVLQMRSQTGNRKMLKRFQQELAQILN